MQESRGTMTRISHNDSIEGRGRSLHLQTHTVEESRKIISTLFEGGRVLSKLEDRYDGSLPETDLREQVEKVHRERINEIELLYAITVKIQTVRHAASLTKLGNQYLRWNLLDEAISELELALQYDPKHGEAYLYLGEAYLRRGGQAEAVRILKKGMKNSPSYADMRLRLGLAHLGGGAFSDALRSFREALALNKEYAEAHFCISLCMIAVVVGDVREKGIPEPMECRKRAWEHLSRAVSLSGRFRTPEVEEILRRLHQGDLKAALTLFRTVHRALPPTIDLNFHDIFILNYMYGDRGREPKVITKYVESLEKCIHEHPNYPDLHNFLGIAYLIQSRNLFNRALHQFQSAVEIHPEYARAKNNLKLAKNEGKGLLILLRSMLK